MPCLNVVKSSCSYDASTCDQHEKHGMHTSSNSGSLRWKPLQGTHPFARLALNTLMDSFLLHFFLQRGCVFHQNLKQDWARIGWSTAVHIHEKHPLDIKG